MTFRTVRSRTFQRAVLLAGLIPGLLQAAVRIDEHLRAGVSWRRAARPNHRAQNAASAAALQLAQFFVQAHGLILAMGNIRPVDRRGIGRWTLWSTKATRGG